MKPQPALAFLAVYNLLQNSLLRERGYVAGNLAATGIGLVWARRSGLEWRELGLSSETAPTGFAVGVGLATVAWGLAHGLRRDRLVGALLDDERLEDVSQREAGYRLAVRFPLGTALFEEVWFRGVLPASLRRHGASRPEIVSNAAFAAWHLIPTGIAIDANRTGVSSRPLYRTGLVLGGSVVAGFAGLGFAAIRRLTSSLAAPWVVHAAVNGLTFWIARARQGSAGSVAEHGGYP